MSLGFRPTRNTGARVDAHLYWRITFTWTGLYLAMRDIQMRSAKGGATQCVGGTPKASSRYDAAHDAAFAFDNNPATFWSNDSTNPSWIQYQFPQKITIEEITINRGGWSNGVPTALSFGASDNGVTFIEKWKANNLAGWADGVTKTFSRP